MRTVRELVRFYWKRWRFRRYIHGTVYPAPYTQFLILGEGRTGTNLLASLLRSHPDISVAGEILNPFDPQGIRTRFRFRHQVFAHIHRSLRSQPGACRGAQTHILHFRLHGIALQEVASHFPDMRFLVVFRRSLAEQFVSWKLAKNTGHWVGTSAKAVHAATCKIDPVEFGAWCDAVRERYAEVESCTAIHRRAVTIAYEDLAQDAANLLAEHVFPFLCVRPHPVSTTLRKQNPRKLGECVENYDEIRDVLERATLHLSLSQ
ncbi:sulfotransferase [Thermostilla marina]